MKAQTNLALTAVLVVSFGTVTPRAYGADLIYQETFPWTNDALDDGGSNSVRQQLEYRRQGWCGGNAGDPFCDNPPGGAPPADNDGGEGGISSGFGNASTVTPSMDVNNNPQGNVVGNSFAFWSQTAINAGSFLYTPEYNPFVSQVDTITWDQTDNTCGDPAHLAFCIDGSWYISNQTFSNPSSSNSSAVWSQNWRRFEVDIRDLSFVYLGSCSDTLPGGSYTGNGGGPLPGIENDRVDAFGFWWDGPKSCNSRFDNVRLLEKRSSGGGDVPSVPALSSLGLVTLLLGLVGFGSFFARRRRR